MLATSPSPTIFSSSKLESLPTKSRDQYDKLGNLNTRSRIEDPKQFPSPRFHPINRKSSARSLESYSPFLKGRKRMVDAATQYSPPSGNKQISPPVITKSTTSKIAGLNLGGDDKESIKSKIELSTTNQSKRPAEPIDDKQEEQNDSPKRVRPDNPSLKLLPEKYENCDTRDLVILISSMLMELIRYNDAIPLKDGQLTRFHSRAPPGISVLDYLQRLTTHATLSPPILLSMVYYIDRLCALYPSFTISTLTVHRFLITSATVASKGLSDSFWTNKTYAKVGGVSLKELALLELEFLTRVDWRIVPRPEVLIDYYKSLIERSGQYKINIDGG